MRLIDVLGRKQLMLIGSLGYIVSLTMVAFAFYSQLGSAVLLLSIMLFIASHAIGQGAVIWVLFPKFFPIPFGQMGKLLAQEFTGFCGINHFSWPYCYRYLQRKPLAYFCFFRLYDAIATRFCTLYDARNQRIIA